MDGTEEILFETRYHLSLGEILGSVLLALIFPLSGLLISQRSWGLLDTLAVLVVLTVFTSSWTKYQLTPGYLLKKHLFWVSSRKPLRTITFIEETTGGWLPLPLLGKRGVFIGWEDDSMERFWPADLEGFMREAGRLWRAHQARRETGLSRWGALEAPDELDVPRAPAGPKDRVPGLPAALVALPVLMIAAVAALPWFKLSFMVFSVSLDGSYFVAGKVAIGCAIVCGILCASRVLRGADRVPLLPLVWSAGIGYTLIAVCFFIDPGILSDADGFGGPGIGALAGSLLGVFFLWLLYTDHRRPYSYNAIDEGTHDELRPHLR